MGLFNFVENFFFISLAITFVLIMLLIFHFKQRMALIEAKHEELVMGLKVVMGIITTLAKQPHTNYINDYNASSTHEPLANMFNPNSIDDIQNNEYENDTMPKLVLNDLQETCLDIDKIDDLEYKQANNVVGNYSNTYTNNFIPENVPSSFIMHIIHNSITGEQMGNFNPIYNSNRVEQLVVSDNEIDNNENDSNEYPSDEDSYLNYTDEDSVIDNENNDEDNEQEDDEHKDEHKNEDVSDDDDDNDNATTNNKLPLLKYNIVDTDENLEIDEQDILSESFQPIEENATTNIEQPISLNMEDMTEEIDMSSIIYIDNPSITENIPEETNNIYENNIKSLDNDASEPVDYVGGGGGSGGVQNVQKDLDKIKDYKKMSLSQLKSVLITRGVAVDTSKMKKAELMSILRINDLSAK